MRISIKELRKAVQEALKEMKLGVSAANPPGAHFQGYAPEHDEPAKTIEDLRPLIAAITSDAFMPNEKSRANQKWNMSTDVHNNWDDEDAEEDLAILKAQRTDKTGPSKNKKKRRRN